jgi:hypothetical protein
MLTGLSQNGNVVGTRKEVILVMGNKTLPVDREDLTILVTHAEHGKPVTLP